MAKRLSARAQKMVEEGLRHRNSSTSAHASCHRNNRLSSCIVDESTLRKPVRRRARRAPRVPSPCAGTRRPPEHTGRPGPRRGCRKIRVVCRYEPSACGISCTISQIWPPGSVKLAVRTPHVRFIGPLNNATPRPASSAQDASTSSTWMVSWKRAPSSRLATTSDCPPRWWQ